MWTSPANSEYGWRDWCEDENWGRSDDDSVYRLTVDGSVDIYVIDSHDDLRFSKRYPDYESVFKEYDGIHLTREGQIDTRIGSEADLCGWDVECVLWDDWHFTSVEQVPEELSQ